MYGRKRIVNFLLVFCLVAVVVFNGHSIVFAQKQLRFGWWETGLKVETMEKLLAEFEENNPDIKIKLELIPWDQYWTKLPVLIAGGRAFDVMFMVSGTVQPYAQMEALLDLKEYLPQDYGSNFVESQWATVTFGDKVISLPFTLTTIATLYNKNAFKTAGIQVPQKLDKAWTWGEFKEAAIKAKKALDSPFGVTIGERDFWFLPWFYQNNASLLNEDLSEAAINSPAALETLSFLRNMVKDKVAASPAEKFPTNPFVAGLVPMAIEGHWVFSFLDDQIGERFDYGATFLPYKKKQAVGIGGDYIAGYRYTKHPVQTASFIKWLTSKKITTQYCGVNYYISPWKGAITQCERRSAEMSIFILQSSVASTPMTVTRAMPGYEEIRKVFQAEFELCMVGEKSPKQALEDMAKSINKILRK